MIPREMPDRDDERGDNEEIQARKKNKGGEGVRRDPCTRFTCIPLITPSHCEWSLARRNARAKQSKARQSHVHFYQRIP